MWSGGITRLSQRLARFVRMTLSFSRVRAQRSAFCSFSIATIWTRLSFSNEPLPQRDLVYDRYRFSCALPGTSILESSTTLKGEK